MGSDKVVDILIWGVTGFTGVLAAQYAAQRYGSSSENLRFGLGGRQKDRLEQIRSSLSDLNATAKDWPIFVANSLNQEEMDAVVSQVRVVATTVGPFRKYGTCLVDACVRLGVDYVDITGEVGWIKDIIQKYHTTAAEKGVIIVNACGFDCIPSDLCAMLVEDVARETLQREIDYMYCAIGDIKGGVGGGTLLSADSEMSAGDRSVIESPFSLTKSTQQPKQITSRDADQLGISWVSELDTWTVPFPLSMGNARMVYRSMYLKNNFYAYREGKSVKNLLIGVLAWVATVFGIALFSIPFVRSALLRWLPQPGQGPSRDVIESGYYNVKTVGVCKPRNSEQPRRVFASMSGKRDPGFGATCRFMVESAVVLALHKKDILQQLNGKGGVLTPSVALGRRLVERLQQNADVDFFIRVDAN